MLHMTFAWHKQAGIAIKTIREEVIDLCCIYSVYKCVCTCACVCVCMCARVCSVCSVHMHACLNCLLFAPTRVALK